MSFAPARTGSRRDGRGLAPIGLAAALCLAGWAPFTAAHAQESAAAPLSTVAASPWRLSLPQAESRALQDNRALAQARTGLVAAQAGLEQAGARPNPTLSLTTQHYRTHGNGLAQMPDHLVSFTQTWERGDKRALRLQQAGALQAMARADEADARRQVLHDVRWAWFELWRTEHQLALAGLTAQAQARTLSAAQTRYRAGDLAGADVARISVESERAQNDLRAAQVDRRHAQQALAALLAVEAHAGELATDDALPDVDAAPSADAEARVEQRADVQHARQAVEAARQAVELARAQRTRDVAWSVVGERDRASGLGPTVGVGFSVPLLWGNTYQGDIARALADQQLAEQQLDAARAAARAELQQAEADVRDAAEQVHRYDEGVLTAARRAAEAAQFAYAHGASSLMDLLDAQRTLHALEVEALQARVAWLKAAADRDAARGQAQPAGG